MTKPPTKKTPLAAKRPRAKQSIAVESEEELIAKEYSRRLPSSKALSEEISFTLKKAIDEADVKIHTIDSRVKELDSAIRKIRDKEYDGLERVNDLIGGRVVCLFRSDLSKIKRVIEEQFQVDEYDDKLIDDPNSFGYMSLHFQCRLRQDYSGPRYDYLKSITFELQLRTIGMHAWSAVQHYLEYKGEWDVPAALKKDINALSALFYVADSQFEAVYAAKVGSSSEADQNIAQNRIEEQAINLDSLEAYLRSRFPDRPQTTPSRLSELVGELKASGYETLAEVARDVDRAEIAFLAHEAKRADGPYHAVGAFRISLGIASKKYRIAKGYSPPLFDGVEHLLKN